MFNQLDENTTLLTPNRRLAAVLLKQHQQYQIDLGKTCWPSLDVLPFSSWIQRLWHEMNANDMVASPVLLSSNQEAMLWREILQQSPTGENLLQLSATAELAKSAWGLMQQWRVDIHDRAMLLTEDSRAFQAWGQEFQKRCHQHHWVDNHAVVNKILLTLNSSLLPKKMMLVGMTEISPLHQLLLDACQALGCEIIRHVPTSRANSIQKIALDDRESEMRTMARWAKKHAGKNIACVVPELEDVRDTVLHIFSEVFSENNSITLDPMQLPFNISAGKSLAAYPVIHTALKLLQALTRETSLVTMSHLIRSPFLGDAETENMSRAHFDMRLRDKNMSSLSLNTLELTDACPALALRIKNAVAYFSQLNKKNQPSVWVTYFIELLTLLGWPGERSLNSQEYQVVQRWLDVLAEFRAFDLILGEQTYTAALNDLVDATIKTPFQQQTPEASIQILGLLEAADLPFDQTWIMGLNDTTWPPSPKPNPFIPQRLQKSLQMPHATAERELAYCQKLTAQFNQSAQHIIYSYPTKNDDAEMRPSSLLKNFTVLNYEQLALDSFTSPADKIYKTQALEFFVDEQAPSIQPHETIRGGTQLFKQQAACPFKAFTELRLHARKIDQPALGLNPKDRGTLVHKALEIFWRDIHDSNQLIKMTQNELQEQIKRVSKQAIRESLRNAPTTRYIKMEEERLQSLLGKWIEKEMTRSPFKVVQIEHEQKITLGPIQATVRVDRIDEIGLGEKIIIDYKTGKHNQIQKWFGDRPDEPQLPLYCISHAEDTVGIAFAQVNPDSMSLIGLCKKELGVASVKNTAGQWEDYVSNWQAVLKQLGQDFYDGIALVDPKDLNETCGYCHLQSVCRIGESVS